MNFTKHSIKLGYEKRSNVYYMGQQIQIIKINDFCNTLFNFMIYLNTPQKHVSIKDII